MQVIQARQARPGKIYTLCLFQIKINSIQVIMWYHTIVKGSNIHSSSSDSVFSSAAGLAGVSFGSLGRESLHFLICFGCEGLHIPFGVFVPLLHTLQ
jgi:hypothetical protein